MKEHRGPYPKVTAQEIQAYNQRVRDLVAGSEKNTLKFTSGSDRVELAAAGSPEPTFFSTRIATPLFDSMPDETQNVVTEKIFYTENSGGEPKMTYDYRAYILDGEERLGIDRFSHAAYKEETKYGLHSVTLQEYQELMDTLGALRPEDTSEKE